MPPRPVARRRSTGNPGTLVEPSEAGAIVPELKASNRQLAVSNRLLAVLATKGMEQRQAILLLDAVGLQSAEIATVLGVSPNAARIALHRARRAAQLPRDIDLSTKEQPDVDA